MEAPRVGSTYAGFRLESVLARGGMGVVYLAHELDLSRRVVVKVLAPELSEDDRFRERFVKEAQIAASLSHPSIIPILRAGEWQGLLYMAMTYIEGTDLRTALQREGPLTPDQAVVVIDQVGSALDYAHKKGLVHRDVKPGNILIPEPESPEDSLFVYLGDFGLGKRAGSKSGITETGQFVGTLDYMAPEQIQGGVVDGRTDQYALGCVLFECLTGTVPYPKEQEAAVLWAHMQEAPPSVSSRAPEVPPSLDPVLAKAMAKAPEDRYATCREFVKAVRGALAPTTVKPAEPDLPHSPVTTTERVESDSRSKVAAATIVGSGSAADKPTTTGSVIITAPRRPDDVQEPKPQRKPWWRSRRNQLGIIGIIIVVTVIAALLSRGPALADARVQGTWSIAFTVTGVRNIAGASSGERQTATWMFVPNCSSGSCDIQLHGGTSTFVLTRNGGLYQSGLVSSRGDCQGISVPAQTEITFQVSKAASIQGQWEATRLLGNASFFQPPAQACAAESETATFTGSLVGT